MQQGRVAPKLQSKMQLHISARNLPKMDALSKSDGFVVMEVKRNGVWGIVGKSETVYDNHDPDFVKCFVVVYMFEEEQDVRITLYDEDKKGQKLQLGVKDKRGLSVRGKDRGLLTSIVIDAEEMSQNNDDIKLAIRAVGLPKMDFFGKSDPYLEFYKSKEGSKWIATHRTEYLKCTLTPRWKPFTISINALSNGDIDRPILIKCFDWNSSGTPDFIGETQCSVRELTEHKGNEPFTLVLKRPNASSKRKRNKDYGKIYITTSLIKNYSFLDYLKGGLNLGMFVAIDYTASNGSPSDPRSLHYMGGFQPNQYIQAIQQICSIVAPYDSDQKFPVWGFGGQVGNQTQHCFPLTGNPANPEVAGVQGILNAYQRSFSWVSLSGPTLFSRIIAESSKIASVPYSQNFQHYSILLILTDGVIQDMRQTVDAIVDASDKPLSIIIVGVGNADFTKMDKLDGDEELLENSRGKKARRDIVQFVSFSEFAKRGLAALSQETLREIPEQFMAYMKQNRVLPLKPRVFHEQQLLAQKTQMLHGGPL